MTAAVLPLTVFTTTWFQLLTLFVAFNTLVYVGIAMSKLWPRRRR